MASQATIFHVSDLHILSKNLSKLRYAIAALDVEMKKVRGGKICVIAGDIFEDKIKVSSLDLAFFYEMLRVLAAHGPVIIIPGTADFSTNKQYLSNTGSIVPGGAAAKVSCLVSAALLGANIPNVFYYPHSTVVKHCGINVAIYSPIDKKVPDLPSKPRIAVMYHAGDKCACDVEPCDMVACCDYDAVLCGGRHESWVIGRAAWSGSLVQKTYLETPNKAFIKWDVKGLVIDSGGIISDASGVVITPTRVELPMYEVDIKLHYTENAWAIDPVKFKVKCVSVALYHDNPENLEELKTYVMNCTNRLDKVICILAPDEGDVSSTSSATPPFETPRWEMVKLSWSNVFRYGVEQSWIEFDQLGNITCIYGANAMGKSNVIAIMSELLFGTRTSRISLMNNSNGDNGMIAALMMINGDLVELRWLIDRRGPSKDSWSIRTVAADGVVGPCWVCDANACTHGRDELMPYIGTKDDFNSITAALQNRYSVFDMRPGERSIFLRRVLGISRLQDQCDEKSALIKKLASDIAAIDTSIVLLSSSIVNAPADSIVKVITNEIEALCDKIDLQSDALMLAEKKIIDYEVDIGRLNRNGDLDIASAESELEAYGSIFEVPHLSDETIDIIKDLIISSSTVGLRSGDTSCACTLEDIIEFRNLVVNIGEDREFIDKVRLTMKLVSKPDPTWTGKLYVVSNLDDVNKLWSEAINHNIDPLALSHLSSAEGISPISGEIMLNPYEEDVARLSIGDINECNARILKIKGEVSKLQSHAMTTPLSGDSIIELEITLRECFAKWEKLHQYDIDELQVEADKYAAAAAAAAASDVAIDEIELKAECLLLGSPDYISECSPVDWTPIMEVSLSKLINLRDYLEKYEIDWNNEHMSSDVARALRDYADVGNYESIVSLAASMARLKKGVDVGVKQLEELKSIRAACASKWLNVRFSKTCDRCVKNATIMAEASGYTHIQDQINMIERQIAEQDARYVEIMKISEQYSEVVVSVRLDIAKVINKISLEIKQLEHSKNGADRYAAWKKYARFVEINKLLNAIKARKALDSINIMIAEGREANELHVRIGKLQDRLKYLRLSEELHKLEAVVMDLTRYEKMLTEVMEVRKHNYAVYLERQLADRGKLIAIDQWLKEQEAQWVVKLNSILRLAPRILKHYAMVKLAERVNIERVWIGLNSALVESRLHSDQIKAEVIKCEARRTTLEELREKLIGLVSDRDKLLSEKHQYEEFNERIMGKNGLMAKTIKHKLSHLNHVWNDALRSLSQLSVFVALDKKDKNINITLRDPFEREISTNSMSGYQSLLMDLTFRQALREIAEIPLPNFMIIDEGFGAADAENRMSIKKLLACLHVPHVLIISHIDEINAIADEHIYISEGSISGTSCIQFKSKIVLDAAVETT